MAKVYGAADKFVTAVQSLARTAFPWANHIIVKKEYVYNWWTPSEERISMPPTAENTI